MAKIVEKSCVPFTQFPPMVMSYIIIVHDQNQETLSGAMCVFLLLSHFITDADACNDHCDQDTALFHCREDLYTFIF